jgi:putative phosphoesterase
MIPDTEKITFGIITDTHIPDRAKTIPKGILTAFRQAKVNQILHAGDAACWKAIKALEDIAPVRVVQGNRDWLFGMRSPREITFTVNNIHITLTHGHRSMMHYVFDKLAYLWDGYRFEHYHKILAKDYSESDVVILGHSHHQVAKWVDGKLFFNPGPAYLCGHNHYNPQFGFISITACGKIRTECHYLY